MPGTLWILSDGGEFEHLASRARRWDRTLHRALRDEIGAAARPAAARARRAVLQSRFPGIPSRPNPRRSTGLRSDIASSIDVTVQDAGNSVGYRIHTEARMAYLTNSPKWRHPVYGNRGAWADQAGSGWWGRAMAESRPELRQAPEKALRRAVREL